MKSWVKMNSWTSEDTKAVKTWFDLDRYREFENISIKEGANKQVISSQADSLIKISRIWADFFPANTSNQPI
ncbi:hypothetical protein [uncultured Enterobacter sp.]|uniref:hypothetical protein n=1 Tax=uncultured Enterobacter sp. TaxID=238202 RepID=UPI0028062D9D|nr:hypothetical protein [uncultured Enterobacter sp.]